MISVKQMPILLSVWTYKASIACMHIMSDNVHVEYMRLIRILNLAPSSKRSLLEKKNGKKTKQNTKTKTCEKFFPIRKGI